MRADFGDGMDGHDEGAGRGEVVGYDEAAHALLPPPPEEPVDPHEQLWHTASFAAVDDEPERRRKLTTGLAVLGGSTLALCGFAGVKLAALAGVTPPSAPRYVINDQVQAQLGESQHGESQLGESQLGEAASPPSPAAGPQPGTTGRPASVRPRSASVGEFRGGSGSDKSSSSGKSRNKDSDKDSDKPKHKRKKSD